MRVVDNLACLIVALFMLPDNEAMKMPALSYVIKASSKSFGGFCVALSLSPLIISSISANAADSLPYGLIKGRVQKCKTLSNCISTSSVNSLDKYSRPWEFTGDGDKMYSDLIKVVSDDPYLKLADKDDSLHYLRAEAKSAVPPTGTDDLEFIVNSADHIITYRTNSRDVIVAGVDNVISDAGSNRNRLENIRRKLGVGEMGMTSDVESYMRENEKIPFFQKMQAASMPNELNFLDNKTPLDALDE